MTVNAKTALAAVRDSDHPFGRPLALCLMFEPTNDQSLAASIFDLAIALEVMSTPAACRTWNVLMSEGRDATTGLYDVA